MNEAKQTQGGVEPIVERGLTVGEFLSNTWIIDHSSSRKYPDGSGGDDEFILHICLTGHGRILDAKVTGMHVAQGQTMLLAKGEETKKRPAGVAAPTERKAGNESSPASKIPQKKEDCNT